VNGRSESVRLQRRLLRQEAIEPAEARRAALARPRTRDDCRDGPRPCPWTSCRHHLGLDVTTSGAIDYPSNGLEPWELAETCALDIAERGDPLTLDQVARILGISRQRVHQVERMALLHLRAKLEEEQGARLCLLCGHRSIGWLGACHTHAEQFARSKVAAHVATGAIRLAVAWEAWVDSGTPNR
jgi:Sigma-70, region 4